MLPLVGCGSEKIKITTIGQFQASAQLCHGERKIAHGNVGPADSPFLFIEDTAVIWKRRPGKSSFNVFETKR